MAEERKPSLSRGDLLNIGRGLQWKYLIEVPLPPVLQVQLLRIKAKELLDKK